VELELLSDDFDEPVSDVVDVDEDEDELSLDDELSDDEPPSDDFVVVVEVERLSFL
jgi:hypothetical protein